MLVEKFGLGHEGMHQEIRATGTRWAQQRSHTIKSLILGYDVIVAHLDATASEESSVKSVDKAKLLD